jgi:mono/diheme cytochrome c family protein
MKKFLIITSIAVLSALIISCKGASGDYPGDVYAPDMYYSRAYETYGYNTTDQYYAELKRRGINYNAMPVPGTIARGEVNQYRLSNDSAGLQAAQSLVNPYDTVQAKPSLLSEGERLYLVNCGICHGAKLDGNGPLFNGGNGPYPAAPPSLVSDAAKAWKDGYIYYVMTNGKGQMGSYASQLHPDQRWWVIKYIRSKQGISKPASGTDTTATASAGTTGQQAAGSSTSK